MSTTMLETAPLIPSPPAGPGKSLVPVPSPASAEERFALSAYKSGLFKDLASASQALIKLQAGKEIGLEPFAALNAFDIIQDKIVAKSQTLAMLLRRAGHRYRAIEMTDTAAEIEFFEYGAHDKNPVGRIRFTIEDAKKAGLVRPNSQWTKGPSDMLWWRAMARGVKRFFPELLGGPFVTPEELGHASSPDVTDAEFEVQAGGEPARRARQEDIHQLRAELAARGIDSPAVAQRYGHSTIDEMTAADIQHYRKTILSKLEG
jgi:hypothetical protein